MKLTEIQLYKNTPFTDLVNTIHFASDGERDRFFDEHYEKVSFENKIIISGITVLLLIANMSMTVL